VHGHLGNIHRSGIEIGQYMLALGFIQQCKLRDGGVGLGNNADQQGLEMLEHAFDGRRTEQIGIELQSGTQTIRCFSHFQ